MTQPKVFFLDDEDFAASAEHSYWVISTPLSDHKFVYRLNNAWPSNFKRSEKDHITYKKDHEFHHAAYLWYDELNERDWFLLTNKGTTIPTLDPQSIFQERLQTVILPAAVRADFVLFCNECVSEEEVSTITAGLRKIPGTVNAAEYEPTSHSVLEALQIELLKTNYE